MIILRGLRWGPPIYANHDLGSYRDRTGYVPGDMFQNFWGCLPGMASKPNTRCQLTTPEERQ